jgi:hypothetical protein
MPILALEGWLDSSNNRPDIRPQPIRGQHVQSRSTDREESIYDYQRRELQRKMKNDEARPSPEAAREEFFPGV